MKVTISGYRYAPESTIVWIDGKIFARNNQFAHDMGMLVIEGKGKEACDRAKREARKLRSQKKIVTIGFFEKDTDRFFYTSQLQADDADLQDKLRVYKEWKRYCESKNCVMNTHVVVSGEISPLGTCKREEKVTEDIVDLTRPVKIRLRVR